MTERISLPPATIEKRILQIRGQNVMLDEDLAVLYEVETKALNQAVKRNQLRFPDDFMFQLRAEENEILRVTNCDLKSLGWSTAGDYSRR